MVIAVAGGGIKTEMCPGIYSHIYTINLCCACFLCSR